MHLIACRIIRIAEKNLPHLKNPGRERRPQDRVITNISMNSGAANFLGYYSYAITSVFHP